MTKVFGEFTAIVAAPVGAALDIINGERTLALPLEGDGEQT